MLCVFLPRQDASASTASKRKPHIECLLCKAKIVLETYECVIFDKEFVPTNDKAAVRGSWKPAYQELILKGSHIPFAAFAAHSPHTHTQSDICTFADLQATAKLRRADETILSDSKVHLKLLDALKNEFKEYSQLWVEINYTVSTFDEMNMCKSRLRIVDKDELERTKQKKTKMDVFTFEIDDNVNDLRQQLNESELQFVRKLGTLKYLKHLEQNKALENCPICDEQPEDKVRYARICRTLAN